MQRVLSKLQAQANGKWVGSNAVHLGDNDTPNAMVWMDKYTQVPLVCALYVHYICTCTCTCAHTWHYMDGRAPCRCRILASPHTSPASPISPDLPPRPFISPHLPASQVPRILTPLIAAVRGLDNMEATPGLSDYVHARFGSAEECRKLMLADFFRHAFDGSGADNYYDAGSCIDGRLTSAWNWCSKLEKKPYVRRP